MFCICGHEEKWHDSQDHCFMCGCITFVPKEHAIDLESLHRLFGGGVDL